MSGCWGSNRDMMKQQSTEEFKDSGTVMYKTVQIKSCPYKLV